MKYIKREDNKIYFVEEVKLNLHPDLAELLERYSQQLHISKDLIVEYLIEMLRVYKLSKKDIENYKDINLLLISSDNNSIYKLVKADFDEKLPK